MSQSLSCPHFPRCGGCQSLNVPYAQQLDVKKRTLEKLFSFAPVKVPEVIPSPEPYYYRHKVQLPFGFKQRGRNQAITLGCYADNSHEVVDQHTCLVQSGDLSLAAWTVREWAEEARLSVYDEKRHTGFLRHVLLRKGAATGEILIGLVTNGARPPGSRNLANSLLSKLNRVLPRGSEAVAGIVQNINERRTNVVLGEHEQVWWGRPFLFEKLGEYRFAVGLSTFFQVNPFQTPQLYNEVLRWVGQGSRVVDVYCGVGSISLWIAKKAATVTGIEDNAASVATAKKAAQANGVRNVRYITADAGAYLKDSGRADYDTAIFDPPRKGLEAGMVERLIASPPARIIYVSCNPETLARDAQALTAAFNCVSLKGVDMFPHTAHIETVAVLDRK